MGRRKIFGDSTEATIAIIETPEPGRCLAYHEAGHAVVAAMKGRILGGCSINPSDGSGSTSATAAYDRLGNDFESEAMILLVGAIVEKLFDVRCRRQSMRALRDIIQANNLIKEKLRRESPNPVLEIDERQVDYTRDQLEAKISELLRETNCWQKIEKVANALIDRGSLTSDELRDLIG